MQQLAIALRALFSKISGDEILRHAGFLHNKITQISEIIHLDSSINESAINQLLQKADETTYSIDQLSMTSQMVTKKWMVPDPNCLPVQFSKQDSVFNMLLHFAAFTLAIKDGDPICRYRHLLRWHTLTTQLGEDMFTTTLLAACNIKTGYNRTYFDWDAFLRHDSKELNALFDRPMAELHMHLKGSSYNVDISWLCLMNNIEKMTNNFDKVINDRKNTDWDNLLYEKVRRAAAIRYYLAGIVGCVSNTITKSQLDDLINYTNSYDKAAEAAKGHKPPIPQEVKINLQNFLTQAHKKNVKDAQKHNISEEYVLDYIPVNHYPKERVANLVMSSERKFMYLMFKKIFSNDTNLDPDTATLFYAYLVYKDYFRHTILQLNKRVGFANFANYEELKTAYITPIYDHLVYKAAIEGFLGNDKDRYVEARIVPKSTPEEISSSIKEIYDSIDEPKRDRCSIIFHFIKKRDESFTSEKSIRHNQLREDVKKRAFAIYQFRQQSKESENPVGKVVGIDAANSEIYARPEVFAQAFRFLRSHDIYSSELERPNDLNITYHVGEDFLDICDGLRAVEEAMLFLGLHNGDRLGHALVLGTDVRTYYQKRYNTICETKQVILDNIAWLYHKCLRLLGYKPICGFLEMMFHRYFRDLYNPDRSDSTNIIEEIFSSSDSLKHLDDIETYYLSWLLRGNSPTFGTDLSPENYNVLPKDSLERKWADEAINHHKIVELACRNEKARELFDLYHSRKIADNSTEVDSFKIPQKYREDYYTLLEALQQDLLRKIENRHIAIECNPSSNYKIGEIERYDMHPIVRFFNYGIETPYPSHNVSVSINTDDQGVFSTSLEREYSLMALAMERNEIAGCKNSPRAIIDWLDRIRQMSLEQRFDQTNKKQL